MKELFTDKYINKIFYIFTAFTILVLLTVVYDRTVNIAEYILVTCIIVTFLVVTYGRHNLFETINEYHALKLITIIIKEFDSFRNNPTIQSDELFINMLWCNELLKLDCKHIAKEKICILDTMYQVYLNVNKRLKEDNKLIEDIDGHIESNELNRDKFYASIWYYNYVYFNHVMLEYKNYKEETK